MGGLQLPDKVPQHLAVLGGESGRVRPEDPEEDVRGGV